MSNSILSYIHCKETIYKSDVTHYKDLQYRDLCTRFDFHTVLLKQIFTYSNMYYRIVPHKNEC